MRNPIFKQAVVVGAGMAGLAAAKAIEPHFEKVTVFDRDSLPDAPAPRSGTPQSRHTHALLAGGTFRARPYVPRERDRPHGCRRRPHAASPRLPLGAARFRPLSATGLRIRPIRSVAPGS